MGNAIRGYCFFDVTIILRVSVKKPNYKWVLFDLDDTLVDFPVQQALEQTLEHYNIQPTAEMLQEYHQLNYSLWQRYNSGEIDAMGLQQTRFIPFAKQIDCDPMTLNNSFLAQIVKLSEPLEGVIETLTLLRDHVNMGIITNGFSMPQRGRINKLGWDQWFDPVVISDEVSLTKPSAEIFQHTLALMGGALPEEVLMVGDNPKTDIDGAAAQGIITCWYNPTQKEDHCLATYEVNHIAELKQIILGGELL